MATPTPITRPSSTTHDLGQGWFANIYTDTAGAKSMTLRNSDKGQRIDLPPTSVATLQAIFKATDAA